MTGHSDLDSPAAVAKRLPAKLMTALSALGEGPLTYPARGIPQGDYRALRAKGLAEGKADRHWTITPLGLEVLAAVGPHDSRRAG